MHSQHHVYAVMFGSYLQNPSDAQLPGQQADEIHTGTMRIATVILFHAATGAIFTLSLALAAIDSAINLQGEIILPNNASLGT